MPQFRIGDIVHLKSGGPEMTISHMLPSGRVFCVWFEGTEKRQDTFPPEALQLTKEKEAMAVG